MAKELESIIINPSLIRDQWLSPELAVRSMLAFKRRFGRKHLELACHAALPSILTPELINLIHINFLGEREIDWIAEMDFLLSPLCHSIEEEVYEVEPCVREVLLLEMENLYGEERAEENKKELAKFLLIYLHQKPQEKQRPEFRKTQEWIARAYLDPDGLIQRMRESLQSSFAEENSLLQLSKQIPVVKNLELLAEPLVKTQQKENYQELMRETRVVAHVLYGEEQITELEEGASLLSSPFFAWLKQSSKIEQQPSETQPEETIVTPPLSSHSLEIETIARYISNGTVVFILGSEINLWDRPLQENGKPERWYRGCEFPPTDNEIAAYLINEGKLGDELPGETLAQVARYLTINFGSDGIYNALQQIYSTNYRPNRLHRFLAKLPTKLKDRGFSHTYPLILTTNYDDVLDKTFDLEKECYDVVSYIAKGENRGRFRHRSSEDCKQSYEGKVIINPGKYKNCNLRKQSVILKIRGALDRSNSFVITEDHYIDYLARTDVVASIPANIKRKLTNSNLLFLGYDLSDWCMRAILHSIWKELPLNYPDYKSWVVPVGLGKLNRQLWHDRNAHILDVPLKEFITELDQRLEAIPLEPMPSRKIVMNSENKKLSPYKGLGHYTTKELSPYKGLGHYTKEDAEFFFGRNEWQETILDNLMASRITLLYGENGVGKSSVLDAGVVSKLVQIAAENKQDFGIPKLAVAMFRSWNENPRNGLFECVQDAAIEALQLSEIEAKAVKESMPKFSTLTEALQEWAKCVGGRLYIILDQFEDYFLYQPKIDSQHQFILEFSEAVNNPNLRANFLISIRDESYAKLDRLAVEIPNLFKQGLRIERLNWQEGREAIEKPISQYNNKFAQQFRIDSELTGEILKDIEAITASQWLQGEAGLGDKDIAAKQDESSQMIETSCLQLVTARLWEEEKKNQSQILRLETYNNLGRADNIVKKHVNEQMEKLSPQMQHIAASVFHYLVTSSRIKIAHTVSELVDLVNDERSREIPLTKEQVEPVLRQLCQQEVRILRSLLAASREQQEEHYEIFHDVLAPAILDWRRQYLEKQQASFRLFGKKRRRK